jgi:hypothetical protein
MLYGILIEVSRDLYSLKAKRRYSTLNYAMTAAFHDVSKLLQSDVP